MLRLGIIATLLQVAPQNVSKLDQLGAVEFSRRPTVHLSHSIKIFVVEGDNDDRFRYLDDIGRGGSRTVSVEAPPGIHKFVVIVEPIDSEVVSPGAPTNPARRRHPNAIVEVHAGQVTPVTIGGFTDFTRAAAKGSDGALLRRRNDQEASQFVVRIEIEEPRQIQ